MELCEPKILAGGAIGVWILIYKMGSNGTSVGCLRVKWESKYKNKVTWFFVCLFCMRGKELYLFICLVQRAWHFPINQSDEDIRYLFTYKNIQPSFRLFIKPQEHCLTWFSIAVRQVSFTWSGWGSHIRARTMACRAPTAVQFTASTP